MRANRRCDRHRHAIAKLKHERHAEVYVDQRRARRAIVHSLPAHALARQQRGGVPTSLATAANRTALRRELLRFGCMSAWERHGLLMLLGPILWAQGRHVRRVVPRLPEPEGDRTGVVGQGPLMRILVAGDSAAAGVGVTSQDEALCGQLVRRLGEHQTVRYSLMAVNGLDSPGLAKMLSDAPCTPFDVVLLSIGVNDVTALMSPARWLAWQNRLAEIVQARFEPTLLIHNAVAPMHAFTALPQPLRWFMGRWAREMNRLLESQLSGHANRAMHWHPPASASEGLAADGFHPGAHGYAHWAESLSRHILSAIGTPPADSSRHASHSPSAVPSLSIDSATPRCR